MRAGEFTSQSSTDATLLANDVAVDSRSNPQVLIVHLRHSKTDPFSAETHLFLGRTGDILCPVAAVLGYLAVRPSNPGPLFVLQDGTPLSRAHLVTSMREALSQAGENTSGHSFRIGAAFAAAQAGLSDSFIQTLGRWKSSAFISYIRTPIKDLVSVAGQLARQ